MENSKNKVLKYKTIKNQNSERLAEKSLSQNRSQRTLFSHLQELEGILWQWLVTIPAGFPAEFLRKLAGKIANDDDHMVTKAW